MSPDRMSARQGVLGGIPQIDAVGVRSRWRMSKGLGREISGLTA
jgi:hypothetical protein